MNDIKRACEPFSSGKRYAVCIADPGPIVFEHDDLKQVYFWCGCISGSMQSKLLIIDLVEGSIIDEFKISEARREV